MRFSQRIGKSPVPIDQQLESMDSALRARLWTSVDQLVLDPLTNAGRLRLFSFRLYDQFFKRPADIVDPVPARATLTLRQWFFDAEWFEVYDIIEFISSTWPTPHPHPRELFEHRVNTVLEQERSGYRLLQSEIIPVTDQTELDAITEAVEGAQGRFAHARKHLSTAITLAFDRKAPDYRNSIKESISAVEAAACVITGKGHTTLGEALKVLGGAGTVHPALEKAFGALYGYTSNADGIRHALVDESTADLVHAKYMLVACSAFVNYLIARSPAAESH